MTPPQVLLSITGPPRPLDLHQAQEACGHNNTNPCIESSTSKNKKNPALARSKNNSSLQLRALPE